MPDNGAVVGLVAHEMVDFSLELPGMAMVGSALLAACIEPSPRRAQSEDASTGRRWTPWVVVALAVSLAVIGIFGHPSRPHDEAEHLLRASRESTLTDERLEAALKAHPLEPGVFMVAGYRRLQSREPDTAVYLNRAMELAPGWPGPHLLAAAWLSRMGRPGQAVLEMRAAEELVPLASIQVACDWAARDPDEAADHLLDAAPREQEASLAFLERLRACAPNDSGVAVAVDARLGEIDPDHPGVTRRRASQAETLAERLDLLRRAHGRRPDDAELRLELARALLDADEADEASELLAEAGADEATWRLRARARLDLGDEAGFADAIGQLRGRSAGSGRSLADVYRFEGRLRATAGDRSRALRAFTKAMELYPSAEAYGEAARAAENLGLEARAAATWSRSCELFGDAEACRHVASPDE